MPISRAGVAPMVAGVLTDRVGAVACIDSPDALVGRRRLGGAMSGSCPVFVRVVGRDVPGAAQSPLSSASRLVRPRPRLRPRDARVEVRVGGIATAKNDTVFAVSSLTPSVRLRAMLSYGLPNRQLTWLMIIGSTRVARTFLTIFCRSKAHWHTFCSLVFFGRLTSFAVERSTCHDTIYLLARIISLVGRSTFGQSNKFGWRHVVVIIFTGTQIHWPIKQLGWHTLS